MNNNRLAVIVLTAFICFPIIAAQDQSRSKLAPINFKNGEQTLRAFEPVSKATRQSIVKVDLNGSTVALAAVIATNGLAITKASELKSGKLTCWLASGKEVSAELIRVDEQNDLALIKVHAKGLQPIRWATEPAVMGQWVVTPGVAETPQAVGIISAQRRKILPKRALIGVRLDFRARGATIDQVMDGLGAAKAGLKSGDRIMAVNGLVINAGEELIKVLRDFRDGQSVKLRVQREKDEFEASVKMMIPSPSSGGRWADREDRMNRMGSEPSERAEGFELALQHDTVLQAWQCGGPLVNLEGKAVGLNIARAGRVASYALPADLVQRAISKLTVESKEK